MNITFTFDFGKSLWEAHAWTLHHDNAPAHTALSIRQFLAERNIATLERPPYFPDLAPCAFFLILKIKSVLNGTHSDHGCDGRAPENDPRKCLPRIF